MFGGDRRRSLPAAGGEPARTAGDPPSANGASSLHLFWELEGSFAAAEVTLTVLEPPTVERLYFWALQAGFTDGGRDLGAAHLGLQWHPAYPAGTAANWGGYAAAGGELAGSASTLPSALRNPHTRDYPWHAGVDHRLRIDRSPTTPGAWRGSLYDPITQRWTVLRELYPGGSHLRSLMVWSEVFARCDDPPVTVRWSDPVAFDDGGHAHRPASVRINYQTVTDGGCTNTTSFVDDVGICQRTATLRTTAQGARLPVPGRPDGH